MIERHNPTLDKHSWGDGPWINEPDKVQWIDPETNLDCLAVRNHMGAWCGYVGVPRSHPFYGKDYNDVAHLGAHGGLTFSDRCQEQENDSRGEFVVCHVPEPGRTDDVWWFGFDCCHYTDYAPGMIATIANLKGTRDLATARASHEKLGEVYRTLEYVKIECTNLAKQLEMEKTPDAFEGTIQRRS